MQNTEVWVFGMHTVKAALTEQGSKVKEIICIQSLYAEFEKFVADLNLNIKIRVGDKDQLFALVDSTQHQGVVAKVPNFLPKSEKEMLQSLEHSTKPPLILVLDSVQDPHNLGACIRSAAAFGVDWIITPKDKAVGLTPSVRKIACGMEYHVKWTQVTNLARCLSNLKKAGVWCFAANLEAGKPIAQMDWMGSCAIVLGAEHKGVRPLVLKQCDESFFIPMQSVVESLNVSVASAICLYEVSRQRGR